MDLSSYNPAYEIVDVDVPIGSSEFELPQPPPRIGDNAQVSELAKSVPLADSTVDVLLLLLKITAITATPMMASKIETTAGMRVLSTSHLY